MRLDADLLSVLLEQDLLSFSNGPDSGNLPLSPRHFAVNHLRKSIFKKYIADGSGVTDRGNRKALKKFLESNDKCASWDWNSVSRTSVESEAIGEAQKFLYDFFYPKPSIRSAWVSPTLNARGPRVYRDRDFILNMHDLSMHVGVGPGASIGASNTDFFTKLCASTLTFTNPALLCFYKELSGRIPTWKACEALRSSRFGEATVSGSKLSYVPKTTEVSRTICTEPILNMFFQKGVQGCLEKRLLEVVGIDLSTQPDINSALAQIGSLDGKFGTIDLSSASDSLALKVLKDFVPKRAFDVLVSMRSPRTSLPTGEQIELQMISSMGNAYTFPLQTIFFSALVFGAYRVLNLPFIHSRGRKDSSDTFAVFGDDIIVLKEAYNLVSRLLYITGFTVNDDKSFNIGHFRESCGHDYYYGHDVRGVFLRTLRTPSDMYSAINRLNRWSCLWGVPLPRLISFLVSRVRFLPIPFDEDDAVGIKVPWKHGTTALRTKDSISLYFYRYLRREPSTIPFKQLTRRTGANDPGALLAFVAGYIRSGTVPFRKKGIRFNFRTRCTPRWDYITPAWAERTGFSHNWKVMAWSNLFD